MNAWKCLPDLRWLEIDCKLSVVYTWHPDSPANTIALHELHSKKGDSCLESTGQFVMFDTIEYAYTAIMCISGPKWR